MKIITRYLAQGLASTLGLWGAVILMTVLADVLFYRQPGGWPYGAFLLLVGLLLLARPSPAPRHAALVRAFLVLAVAAGAVIYRGGMLAAILSALALAAMAGACAAYEVRHAEKWACVVVNVPAGMIRTWIRDIRLLRRRRSASRRAGAAVARLSIAWVVPVILALIFLGLFCLANPMIERWVGQGLGALRDFLRWLKLPEVSRVLFWTVVAAGLWGLWRIRRHARAPMAPPPLPPLARPPEGQPALALRCLGLLNILFALETVTDLIYLWGWCALPPGMTYASYAHRGAYPLVVTALLSAGLTLFWFQPGRRAERDLAARVLVLVWLAQNVLLTASAVWRLHLYVDVYTLTRLRVAVFVWMSLVGFGLLSIGWRIVRRHANAWLLDVNTVVLLAVLLGCAWWPMDGYIARHNVQYCQEAGGPGRVLDIEYLQQLGPEAMHALQAYARLPGEHQQKGAAAAEVLAATLQQELRNPRAWTIRRGFLARWARANGG